MSSNKKPYTIPSIRIDISGTDLSGKTMMAAKIAHILDQGFKKSNLDQLVEIDVFSATGDFAAKYLRMREGNFSLEGMKALRVVIVDRNMPFADPDDNSFGQMASPDKKYSMKEPLITNGEPIVPTTRPVDLFVETLKKTGVQHTWTDVKTPGGDEYHLTIAAVSDNFGGTSPLYTSFVFDEDGEFKRTAVWRGVH